ncbi:hypothetical protein D3C87_1911860 [compost metagenome]
MDFVAVASGDGISGMEVLFAILRGVDVFSAHSDQEGKVFRDLIMELSSLSWAQPKSCCDRKNKGLMPLLSKEILKVTKTIRFLCIIF